MISYSIVWSHFCCHFLGSLFLVPLCHLADIIAFYFHVPSFTWHEWQAIQCQRWRCLLQTLSRTVGDHGTDTHFACRSPSKYVIYPAKDWSMHVADSMLLISVCSLLWNFFHCWSQMHRMLIYISFGSVHWSTSHLIFGILIVVMACGWKQSSFYLIIFTSFPYGMLILSPCCRCDERGLPKATENWGLPDSQFSFLAEKTKLKQNKDL